MRRRYLVPEVIQTSAMDCGPASLEALLEGHGIHASYGRLREACQTEVDGSSIDSLESVAVALGLDAAQIMIPEDFLFEPEVKALPSLIVVRNPDGSTHFVIFWRKHGPFIQVMDPGVGRRWVRATALRNDLYIHTQSVPAEDWNEWASGDAFRKPLARRLVRLGAGADLLDRAGLARVDAAARMVQSLVECGAVRNGREAGTLVRRLAEGEEEIPREYWSAPPDPANADNVLLRGAVLIQVNGRKAPSESLTADLAAALAEKPARPGLAILREFFASGIAQPSLIAVALALASTGVVVDAVLWRGFLNMARELVTAGQRATALTQMVAFGIGMLVLDFSTAGSLLRLGRRLEVRLRTRFLEKIPRLGDRYFQSRPNSDMAQRVHNVQILRTAPALASQFWRAVVQCTITLAAIGWLYPDALPLAAVAAAGAFGIPLAVQPSLAERDLKVRTHAGALTRYYLDALLGLTAIRAHDAAGAVRHEQRLLLAEWAVAAMRHHRVIVVVETLQFTIAMSVAAWLIGTRLENSGDTGGLLLLVYWVMSLPLMGREAAAIAWQYPLIRNTALRLGEPLGAPEEDAPEEDTPEGARPENTAIQPAAAIRFEAVSVRASGHNILEDVDLDIPAGAHVGIVGPSGAGKSSFVGLLLGWHRAAAGLVTVDGVPLDTAALTELRRATAWVDPQVQIWNRSLFDNLRYGLDQEAPASMDRLLAEAELGGVVERLPDGLQTVLGEGGGLVSGGEGQRVRLGRAMARSGVRLAILDEPARGLDRSRRRAMIERARERWKGATLLCITHDVSDTLPFERVLVIDNGRVVEDGVPAELSGQTGSRYRQLLDAEDAVRRGLWASASWRKLRLIGHGLHEERSAVRAGPDL
ncbi:MAG: ATP-binding cassette domain-containing protein [Bryobacteraceae bacterium]